jgi:hypothetical protein
MKLSPIKKVGEKREEKDLDSGEDSVPSGVNVSTEEDQNL